MAIINWKVKIMNNKIFIQSSIRLIFKDVIIDQQNVPINYAMKVYWGMGDYFKKFLNKNGIKADRRIKKNQYLYIKNDRCANTFLNDIKSQHLCVKDQNFADKLEIFLNDLENQYQIFLKLSEKK